MTSLALQEADHDLSGWFLLPLPRDFQRLTILITDGDGNSQASGVTSQTLWDSLNIALLMFVPVSSERVAP